MDDPVSPPLPTKPKSTGWAKWVLWLGILAVVGFYLYSSRSVPAAFQWRENFEEALATAGTKNQLVLLAFHTAWCGYCRQMDRDVFARPEVAAILAHWIPVHIDADRDRTLAARYRVSSLPTFYILSPQGKELLYFEGAMSANDFIAFLRAGEAAYTQATSKPN